MKLFIGDKEVEFKTANETLLAAALKATLLKHGQKPWLKYVTKEFELDRYAFSDAANFHKGNIQIALDSNNGNNLVRLLEE